MAIEEAYVTDIRKVMFDGKAMRAIFGGQEVLRMMYGGEIVFNRALYHLDVPTELSVEATGGTWDSLLSSAIASYKTDRDGEVSHVEVVYPDSEGVAPNPNEYKLTGTYEVRQQKSGLSIKGTWTQEEKKFSHYSVRQVWDVNVDYDQVGAGGGVSEPSVSVTMWLNVHWTDGSVTSDYKAFVGSVTSATGRAENSSGATINRSNGVVTVSGLGTTETDERSVFSVETLAGTVTVPILDGYDTFSWNWNKTTSVSQMENRKHTSYGDSVITVSASPVYGIQNLGGTSVISATATQSVVYTWDSGAPAESGSVNLSGVLSTDLGRLSVETIVGSGTSTLTLGENFLAARSATVTLSVGSTTRTCTVSQNAASYVLSAEQNKECNATASVVYVDFTSSCNGKVWQPSFTTNLAGATVGTPTLSGTTYTVPVSIPENTSLEARDIVVTATQTRYDKDATASVTITQAAAADIRPKCANRITTVYANIGMTQVAYSVFFDATDKSKYKGGTLVGLELQTYMPKSDGGEVLDRLSIGNITIAEGGVSETYTGTFKAQSGCLFRVYYDSAWRYEEQPDEYQPEE